LVSFSPVADSTVQLQQQQLQQADGGSSGTTSEGAGAGGDGKAANANDADPNGGDGGGDDDAENNLRESEKLALASLGAAISRVEDPFFCNGEVELPGTEPEAEPGSEAWFGSRAEKLNVTATLLLKPRTGSDSEPPVPLTLPAPFYHKEPEKQGDRWRHCSYDPLQFNPKASRKKLDESPLTAPARAAFRAFEVSPFGHGGETVVDESVRKAMQVR